MAKISSETGRHRAVEASWAEVHALKQEASQMHHRARSYDERTRATLHTAADLVWAEAVQMEEQLRALKFGVPDS